MTSNDNQQYITVELFNSKMDTLLTQIKLENEKLRSELKGEIQAVRDIAISNSAKIDAHWEASNIWFSVIAILVAAFGCIASFIAIFRESSKDKNLTEQKVQSMIDASVSQAVNNTLAKILGVSSK